MNIIKFIESFTKEGFIEGLSTTGSRRDSFTQFRKLGAGAALAAVPFGLSSVFSTKAYAGVTGTADTTAALQLALTLEYLEDEFYQRGLDEAGLIPASERDIIAQISKHESAHVEFLKGALGNNAPAKPTFDFTANGAFDTFDNYETFLALSQAFEDTGVRAYKGQAGNLMGNGDLLTAALQIHSVEAMHASQIRRLRGEKGWIEGSSRGDLPSQAQAVYDGEGLASQAGFNTSGINGIPAGAGPESFDEPLTGEQATAIASLFVSA